MSILKVTAENDRKRKWDALPLTRRFGVVQEWLLQGEYQYKFDGKKLIFSKTASVMADNYSYEFELKRK